MALSAVTSLLRQAVTFASDIPRRDALIHSSFGASIGSVLYGNSIFPVVAPIFLYLANSSKDPSSRSLQSRVATINLLFTGFLLGKLFLGRSNAAEATFALINTAAAADLYLYANNHSAAQVASQDVAAIMARFNILGPTPARFEPTPLDAPY